MVKRPPTIVAARVPDPADVWEDEVAELAAKAMAVWLKGSVHLSRSLNSLTKAEMKKLALQAIHTWIVAASQRVNQPVDPGELRRLRTLLLG